MDQNMYLRQVKMYLG